MKKVGILYVSNGQVIAFLQLKYCIPLSPFLDMYRTAVLGGKQCHSESNNNELQKCKKNLGIRI